MEHERGWTVAAVVAETRATVGHLAENVTELRQDVRRLDGRLFQLLLAQLATPAAALGALLAALAS
jgi:hypothetical protein